MYKKYIRCLGEYTNIPLSMNTQGDDNQQLL